MNRKSFRAAIVGVGKGGEGKAGIHGIGYAHAAAYQKHPQFDLVGACDLNAENLSAFAKTFAVPATNANFQEMLRVARPDVVSICTYAGSHRALLDQCLEAGIRAVWCEKPLCLTMDDGRAMREAAERAGARVIVNHFRRYLHLFREARRLVGEGGIGRLSLIVSSLKDWDLMEWGTHWLDMMRFLTGDQPVSWVMGQARCSGAKKAYGHLMEEHSLCYFALADETRGFLDGGLAIPGNAALTLIGDRGSLDLRWDGTVVLVNADGIREIPVKSNLHGALPGHPEEDPWQLLLDDFAAWISGGAEPQCSLRNGLLSSELFLAAYESAKIGDRIDLPLTSQSAFPLMGVAERQSTH